jgi:hypothetical protein
MIHLHIVVEGDSEERFVNEVLAKYLIRFDIYATCRKLQTGWHGNIPAKGGLLKYIKFRNDILRWVEADRQMENVWYSSMLDLYAFPIDDQSPYTADIRRIDDPYRRIAALEAAISVNINHARFIPYVQLHEFETFIMVDPDRLLELFVDRRTGIIKLRGEIEGKLPELINDSPRTAPSKRIIKFIPEYQGLKSSAGPLIAEDIGIPRLREACPHFNEWVTKLENLAE